MKRLMILLFAVGMTTLSGTVMAGMSKSAVRKEARFLTDKMSYELNLNAGQRNDVYEINYDFIYSAADVMDGVLRDETRAVEHYYYLLDIRNDDLRWVLNDAQYRRFIQADYFYRPIYANGNKWSFRIYITYTNHNHFFFGKPQHYATYHYAHHRHRYNQVSYYRNRYNHPVYQNRPSVRNRRVYDNHRRVDFNLQNTPPASRPRPSVGTTVRPAAPKPNIGSGSSTSTGRRPAATSRSRGSSSKSGTGTERGGSRR